MKVNGRKGFWLILLTIISIFTAFKLRKQAENTPERISEKADELLRELESRIV